VASCDLSHFPAYDDADRVDRKTLEAIATLDPETLRSTITEQMGEGVPELGTCACGEAPVLAAMIAAKRLGATGGQIISYANSGDTSVGDRSRVVGYGAVAFVTAQGAVGLSPAPRPKTATKGGAALAEEQGRSLLSFARRTIRQYLTTDTAPLARGFAPALENEEGAFVTLRKKGDLRGCIGHMAQDLPLCQVVGYCALQAAFNDRRFTPVELDELADIDIEISVLTPYQPVNGYEDIRIGRDGVLIQKDGRSAVFLPSVAVEQGWTRDEMLSHLSLKAGLPSDAWKKDAKFYTFQAVVFSESEAQ
jgi:AmmeMemoRadiSam system protein A